MAEEEQKDKQSTESSEAAAPAEKVDEAKTDTAKTETAKTDTAKADTAKAEDGKKDEAKPEATEDTLQSVLSEGEDDVTSTAGDGKQGKRKNVRRVPFGIAHVRATFNNTVVTITDAQGAVLGWSSGGRSGFKGSRKSTAFAAGRVGQDAARQAMARGMKEVEVRVQGPGAGRETAIRALQSAGLTIAVIKDVTPMPHNGCRPRKRRRV